ncbi:unnamed protein product [Closterium sp. NIES-53]
MLVNRNVKIVEDVMYKDWQQQQRVQISLRLQKIERSAVEEVQLHLDDLPGSELTSDHNGGGEQQVAGPAVEASLDLQDVQGRVTVALQGEAGKPMLIPDVLYVPGVQANLLLAGQLKENDVKLQEDGDGMLLVLAAGDMLDRAKYIGRILYTDLRPCTTRRPWTRRGWWFSGMLARHTFPDKGSNTKDALAVVHINLCRPFRVAAKDSNLYLLLLKDRKTRYVWVRPVAKKSLVLRELEKWLVVAERQMKKSVLMLRSDRGLEFWKSEHGPASGWTQASPPTGTSTVTLPLLAEVGELAAENAEDVRPPSPSPAPPAPPLVADLPRLTLTSASSDEGSNGASLVALAKSITRGQRDVTQVGVGENSMPTGEQQAVGRGAIREEDVEDSEAGDDRAEQLGAEESTDSNVMEVPLGPRRSGRTRRPLDFLSYHACLPPAAFTMVYDEVDDDLLYDDAEEDVDLPKLDPNMQADPEHRWDIALMTVKEVLARWKGKVVKAAMDEEIRSLVSKDTWVLVKWPPGENIMKNRWVLITKYRIDDTVEREKIDMKNAFLQSKLDWVLYMYQLGYYNDETGWERRDAEGAEAAFDLREILLVEKYLGLEIVHDCKLGSGLTVRSDQHWREVDHCLAYLANTRDTALEFDDGPDSLKLVGYVDANDASNKQNRTSTGGYVFVYGGAALF